jgi:hypothetical protein
VDEQHALEVGLVLGHAAQPRGEGADRVEAPVFLSVVPCVFGGGGVSKINTLVNKLYFLYVILFIFV